MPWTAPYRPRSDSGVTQSFSDGIVTIYSVRDEAVPGYKPAPELTKKITLRYEEQRLGIQRYYAGRQNQLEIERVLRVPRAGSVSSQDIAETEDGRRYRINLVQTVPDSYPESVDLTLSRITQTNEVTP